MACWKILKLNGGFSGQSSIDGGTKKKIGALEQIAEGLSKLDMAKDCCEEDRPQNALLLALQKMSGFNVCNSLGNNEGAWRTIET